METPRTIKQEYLEPLGLEDAEVDVDINDCKLSYIVSWGNISEIFENFTFLLEINTLANKSYSSASSALKINCAHLAFIMNGNNQIQTVISNFWWSL